MADFLLDEFDTGLFLTNPTATVNQNTGITTLTVNCREAVGTLYVAWYAGSQTAKTPADIIAGTGAIDFTSADADLSNQFVVPFQSWDADYFAAFTQEIPDVGFSQVFYTDVQGWTFTRTSEATVVDFEGNLKELPNDAAAHPGARVVVNVLSDVSTIAWEDRDGATHVDNIGGGYLGSNSITVTFGGNAIGRVSELYDVASNHGGAIDIDSVASYWLRADAPTTCRIYSATASAEVSVTTEWQRFSLTRSWTAQDARSYGLLNNATGTSLPVQMCMSQAEINPYLSNIPPSEFVTDVQSFDYENGNTVDANGVVTELAGAAITGLEGVLLEGARTRLNSDSPVTQNVTVAAVPHTISVIGTGSIDITGVSTGTATAASPLTFTPTAGSLTCTVVGSVDNFQVEPGAFPSSYIPGAGTGITRAATAQVRTLASMGLEALDTDFTVMIKFRYNYASTDIRTQYRRVLNIATGTDDANAINIHNNLNSGYIACYLKNDGEYLPLAKTDAWAAGETQILGVKFSSASFSFFCNGAFVTTQPTKTAFTVPLQNVCVGGSVANSAQGNFITVEKLEIIDSVLTDEEMLGWS